MARADGSGVDLRIAEILVDEVLVAAWIFEGFVGDTAVAPSPQVIAYKILMGTLATIVLSIAVAVPMGLAWTWLVRRASPPRP